MHISGGKQAASGQIAQQCCAQVLTISPGQSQLVGAGLQAQNTANTRAQAVIKTLFQVHASPSTCASCLSVWANWHARHTGAVAQEHLLASAVPPDE